MAEGRATRRSARRSVSARTPSKVRQQHLRQAATRELARRPTTFRLAALHAGLTGRLASIGVDSPLTITALRAGGAAIGAVRLLPDHDGECGEDREFGRTERARSEEVLKGRYVDERREEDEFERDAPEQHWVGEEADRAEGGALGARRDRGADLACDDAGKCHRGRLQVSAVQGGVQRRPGLPGPSRRGRGHRSSRRGRVPPRSGRGRSRRWPYFLGRIAPSTCRQRGRPLLGPGEEPVHVRPVRTDDLCEAVAYRVSVVRPGVRRHLVDYAALRSVL